MDSSKLPKLLVKKLDKDAIIPKKGSDGAAAYDLYALNDCNIKHLERKVIGTGIAIGIPKGWYGRVAPRSGMSKNGISVEAGVVDSDYRGEIFVMLSYIGKTTFTSVPNTGMKLNHISEFEIAKGDRIAQLIITRCTDVEIEEVDDLPVTKRGSGKLGSTGK